MPTSMPTPDNGIRRVQIPLYYIAFDAPGAEREAQESELEFVTQVTTLYLEEILASKYKDSSFDFVRLDNELVSQQFQAGFPEERFNLYMEFDADVVFRVLSDAIVLPSPDESFESLVNAILDPSYIVAYVWQALESPFAKALDVVVDRLPDTIGSDFDTRTAEQSVAFQALEGRFILPGSRIPSSIFRSDNERRL